jgi:porphobilinogen deaminase
MGRLERLEENVERAAREILDLKIIQDKARAIEDAAFDSLLMAKVALERYQIKHKKVKKVSKKKFPNEEPNLGS